MTDKQLRQKALLIRQTCLNMQTQAQKGHLGGAFSATELLVALYYSGLVNISPKKMKDKNRDRIILSKGHACLALYAILADKGFFNKKELLKFGWDGSLLGGHPDHFIPGVEVSSGSLGHGLGIGAGLALSAKLNKQLYSTFVILGDGECAEGSIWETAGFAVSQNLDNLIAIVDNNKVAATSRTSLFSGDVSMTDKWSAFGWETVEVLGHDFKQILTALNKAKGTKRKKPLAIIAQTIKGKGVSFMEGDHHWHHGVPNAELLAQAEKELDIQ